jgi:hypothetical protein
MRAADARDLAERVHSGDLEPDGTLVLEHLRRVVAATPPEAHAVAWLHEALEAGCLTERELRLAGFDPEEVQALRLLSRRERAHSDRVYLVHLEAIIRAPGRSGRLARAVKAADLADRCAHPRRRADGWAPPYARALQRLLDAHGGRPDVPLGQGPPRAERVR